jgi:hypothetical protein
MFFKLKYTVFPHKFIAIFCPFLFNANLLLGGNQQYGYSVIK